MFRSNDPDVVAIARGHSSDECNGLGRARRLDHHNLSRSGYEALNWPGARIWRPPNIRLTSDQP